MVKKIFIIFVISFFSIVALDIEPVQAEGVNGLVISPKRVVFEGRERAKEVVLANRGESTKRYRISVVNKAMTETGELIEVEEPGAGEFFADKVIRHAPRQVTLDPKETQKIKLLSRLTAANEDGEYRSHLLVQEIPNDNTAQEANQVTGDGLQIKISAIFGLTVPVIIRKGDLESSVSISDALYRKAGDSHFVDFYINREGNKSILGAAKVYANGQEIGILKNIAVYLSTPRRKVSIQLNPELLDQLAGKDIRIAFGEGLDTGGRLATETTIKAQ